MRRLGRAVIALGLLAVAVALFVAWYVFGSWPVPDGYSFPRHSMWGGPAALYAGALEDVDGCIRTAQEPSFAVVWPPGYRLTLEGSEPVVLGRGRAVPMGEPVRMGGGYDEDGSPAPGSRDVGLCSSPYFLSTGFTD